MSYNYRNRTCIYIATELINKKFAKNDDSYFPVMLLLCNVFYSEH